MKKEVEKKSKVEKPVSLQDLKDYISERQKAFTQQLQAKADAAGVKLDVRVLVDIQHSEQASE